MKKLFAVARGQPDESQKVQMGSTPVDVEMISADAHSIGAFGKSLN